jgi:hypothetical protein
MAHCPYEKLSDLKGPLAEIGTWPDVREKRPGVFYIKSNAFLHFHLKDERRWADVRSGATWGPEIDIPLNAGASARARFVRDVRACYEETLAAGTSKRRSS